MNFSSPQKVYQTIRAGDTTEWRRGNNRTKITAAANGQPPLTDIDSKRLGININVNWGEMASILAHARRQYYNSFVRGSRYFKATLPLAPEQYRTEWSLGVTDFINRVLKKSKDFFHIHQYRWTDVVVHGVGSVRWPNPDTWIPRFVAREDLRIPTDTETSFRNLDWFCHRVLYTPGELVNEVFGEHSNDCWNKKGVASILKAYKDINYDSPLTYIDWETQPEKMAEIVKQNLGYYESDAMPSVPLFCFYFKDVDRKWYLRVIADRNSMHNSSWEPNEFLYEDDEPEANNLNELLHCQFGDLSFKSPFMFHSVRSLGFLLIEPCFYTNLTRCRLLQHVHQDFSVWMRIGDPSDKARAQEIDLSGPRPIIPTGVTVMGPAERPQINPDLVESTMGQLKQLMQEASATYTQQIDTGTRKEQTAFETGVKVQQVNALLSGLMLIAGTLEAFFYQEIFRRFCRKDSLDEDVKDFRNYALKTLKMPAIWLDPKRWDIEVEQPLGAGNPTMEMVQAEKLMAWRPMLNPTAQQEVLHDALAVFADPRRAARWAPMDGKRQFSDAMDQAQHDFGSLMWGSPVPIRDELNVIDQIETLIGKLSGVIVTAEKNGNMASDQEILGMATVSDHIKKLVKRVEQDPQEKQRAKGYMDAIGQLDNQIKMFAKNSQQQKQSQNGHNGDAAKLAGDLRAQQIKAEADSKIKTAKAAQQMAHKEKAFALEQKRKNAATINDIARENAKTRFESFKE